MDQLNRERINDLIQHQASICISIFMPTHRAGRERQQDAIRLKNLLGEARTRMLDDTESEYAADEILLPASNLRFDDEFWLKREEGMACFCAPEFFCAYQVPFGLNERVYVNRRFHVRPLLPLLRGDARIYILALTQESAKLFEATKFTIQEVELPELSRFELDGAEPALQYHSHKAPAQGKGATGETVYHGQGGVQDRSKKDTLRFFQMVDASVSRILRGRGAPLVLACVGYLAPLYESTNRNAHLIHGKVPGSPERWSESELRDHAWTLVEPHFRREQQKAWQEFQRLKERDGASDDVDAVVLAADQGRVETLFLVRGVERWGLVDPRGDHSPIAAIERKQEELLDYAAAKTVSNGGAVVVMDSLPNTESPVAATFRY
jgi:hypothetical protein